MTAAQPIRPSPPNPHRRLGVPANARPEATRGVLARVLVLNLVVVAIKVIVGIRTGALSVLRAALESTLDLVNNVIGMILVSVAARARRPDVRRLVDQIPRIAEVRSVRSRPRASGVAFAEVTVGVAGSTTVADAQAIADEVEARIAEALGASEVVVHVEPT